MSYLVYWGALGSHPLTVGVKYLGQAVETLAILLRERPSAVSVMSPPVFAALTAWFYCAARGIPLAIDAHTAAFAHPRWRRLQWLQRALSRRAATTIVTNEHLAEALRAAGAHATIVRDVPIEYDHVEAFPVESPFPVAVVCSFNPDEPIAEVFEAARRLPDLRFYVTGNPRHLARDIAAGRPANVVLTGFLSDAEYAGLLTSVGAVLTLTTRDHTMLRGAYEAIYQGVPVVISDWPLLRDAFGRGAVHVDNSAEGIVSGINRIRGDQERYRREAAELREQKLARWSEVRTDLRRRLSLDATR